MILALHGETLPMSEFVIHDTYSDYGGHLINKTVTGSNQVVNNGFHL